ncbi:MAG: hypothetical protein PHG82_04340 [Candidatus Gracilibacteria bacterium]|nr:hypothetical protein [Candidatus Gracilibacteria bacterium]
MRYLRLSLLVAAVMDFHRAGSSSCLKISKYKIEPWRMMNNHPWEKNKKNQRKKHRR